MILKKEVLQPLQRIIVVQIVNPQLLIINPFLHAFGFYSIYFRSLSLADNQIYILKRTNPPSAKGINSF